MRRALVLLTFAAAQGCGLPAGTEPRPELVRVVVDPPVDVRYLDHRGRTVELLGVGALSGELIARDEVTLDLRVRSVRFTGQHGVAWTRVRPAARVSVDRSHIRSLGEAYTRPQAAASVGLPLAVGSVMAVGSGLVVALLMLGGR